MYRRLPACPFVAQASSLPAVGFDAGIFVVRASRPDKRIKSMFQEPFAHYGLRLRESDSVAVIKRFLKTGTELGGLTAQVEEVAGMCGASHERGVAGKYYGAGSAPGQIDWEGRREDIKRPRVRSLKENGESEEVRLKTYPWAQDKTELKRQILTALECGKNWRG